MLMNKLYHYNHHNQLL